MDLHHKHIEWEVTVRQPRHETKRLANANISLLTATRCSWSNASRMDMTSDPFALNQAPNDMDKSDQKLLVTEDIFHPEATGMEYFAHVFPSFKRPMKGQPGTARLKPLIQNHGNRR